MLRCPKNVDLRGTIELRLGGTRGMLLKLLHLGSSPECIVDLRRTLRDRSDGSREHDSSRKERVDVLKEKRGINELDRT